MYIIFFSHTFLIFFCTYKHYAYANNYCISMFIYSSLEMYWITNFVPYEYLLPSLYMYLCLFIRTYVFRWIGKPCTMTENGTWYTSWKHTHTHTPTHTHTHTDTREEINNYTVFLELLSFVLIFIAIICRRFSLPYFHCYFWFDNKHIIWSIIDESILSDTCTYHKVVHLKEIYIYKSSLHDSESKKFL